MPQPAFAKGYGEAGSPFAKGYGEAGSAFAKGYGEAGPAGLFMWIGKCSESP